MIIFASVSNQQRAFNLEQSPEDLRAVVQVQVQRPRDVLLQLNKVMPHFEGGQFGGVLFGEGARKEQTLTNCLEG